MRDEYTQSFEDFERIMEDYFQVIPPDSDFFKLELLTKWEFFDLHNVVVFYFNDDWDLTAFLDTLEECPLYKVTFDLEEDIYGGIDRDNLKISVQGKIGGLLG